MDAIKPDYYKFTFPGGLRYDIIDIAKAMNLPFTLSLALKYFRVKGDIQKQINDLEKAKECIQREIDYLNRQYLEQFPALPF